jgi:hypothetical protein
MPRVPPFLALLSLAFAPAPPPRPPRGDLKVLQGTWVKVVTERDEAEWAANAALWGDPPSRPPKITCTITSPKRVTLPFSGRIFGSDRIEALYKFDDDVLVICFSTNLGGPPPSAFPAQRDRDTNLLIFRRAAPETPPPAGRGR